MFQFVPTASCSVTRQYWEVSCSILFTSPLIYTHRWDPPWARLTNLSSLSPSSYDRKGSNPLIMSPAFQALCKMKAINRRRKQCGGIAVNFHSLLSICVSCLVIVTKFCGFAEETFVKEVDGTFIILWLYNINSLQYSCKWSQVYYSLGTK